MITPRANTVRAKSRRTATTTAALDCTFLTVVTALSLAPYVGRLGFYYDDYSVLSNMRAAHEQSLRGLYDAVRPLTGQRPLQALTYAGLYRVFGLHALGYHVFNSFLLVAVASLFYLVLRELDLSRLVCVAVPLVYATLPHYATNRFWFDAFQITLSSAFYLLSLYAGLRALRARRSALPLWLPIAVAGVAASLLAYELVLPLFALNVGLLWWVARRSRSEETDAGRGTITIGIVAAAVVAVGLAKTALVAEHGQNSYQIGFGNGVAHHLGYLVSGGVKLNLGTYFLALPYVLWWIVQHRFSVVNAGVAVGSGLLALAYLRNVARHEGDALAARGPWRVLLRIGVIAFVLGYAIFLINQNILFRSAGIDNRVNAAAALGVAGIFVGATGWLALRVSMRRRTALFSTAIACAVAAGVFVVDTLGSFWTSAAQRQHALVSDLRRLADPLPASSTVILDGTCPEIGPAVVFADQSDFRGALRIATHDPSLVADVASESLRSGPRGLVLQMTFLGVVSTRKYAYGGQLLVYNAADRRLYHLRDRGDAARYLARSRPSFRCPTQRSFAWGSDPSQRFSLP
jgi:hypothetical protein